jgi:membrane-associated phospholipid phosphatase
MLEDDYINFLDSIGYFGNNFSVVITCLLIYKQIPFLISYLIFIYLLNTRINHFLKSYFNEKRPKNPIKFLDEDQFSETNLGMPSGHTQIACFSILYAYLVTKQIYPWIALMIIICIIIFVERYAHNNHSIKQLVGGCIIGGLLAPILFYSTKWVIGKFK